MSKEIQSNPRLENYFEVNAGISKNQWDQKYDHRFQIIEQHFPSADVAVYEPEGYEEGQDEEFLPIVDVLPYTHDLKSHLLLRSAIIGETQADGPRKVIVVPANRRLRIPVIDYSNYEPYVANGDFSIFAASVAWTLEKLNIEKVDVSGYSVGAPIGLEVVKRAMGENSTFEVGHAWLAEPPNVVERTPRQLKKDFQGEGLKEVVRFIRTVRESEFRPYIESIGTYPRFLWGLSKFGVASMIPSANRAVLKGMTTDTFVTGMQDLSDKHWSSLYMTIARAEESLITPPEPFETLMNLRHNPMLDRQVISGGGHERGDQVRQIAGHVATAFAAR